MKTYLRTEAVAELLGVSLRTIHERTRTDSIPCRRLPGLRRVLFDEAELQAWVDGASLEVITTSSGARIVRPVRGAS